MKIRCHYLGMVAGFALVLSLSAAADQSWSSNRASLTAEPTPILLAQPVGENHPAPAPVLLLAAGLFGGAAMVRWRQRQRDLK